MSKLAWRGVVGQACNGGGGLTPAGLNRFLSYVRFPTCPR